MRFAAALALMAVVVLACDDQRVYEKNIDFSDRTWIVGDRPVLEFEISDTTRHYDLLCNIRNSLEYPYARIFINYYLRDSAGEAISRKMVRHFLFDEKTGEPLGTSGLGDLYHHRVPLEENFRFPYAGKYSVAFDQYMRLDTLPGIVAVGLRVERGAAEVD